MKKCRSKCTLIIGIIFMTASLCFVLYPSVSNAVNSFFAASTINNYAANLDSISAADRSQYLSAAAEYNNNLSELVNGFTYDVDSVIDGYDDILNFGDGLIGYIDISKINVKKCLKKVLLICQIQRFRLEVWAIILSCLHIRVILRRYFLITSTSLKLVMKSRYPSLMKHLLMLLRQKTLLSPTTYRYCQLTKKKTY